MTAVHRHYRDESDYWRCREFLREMYQRDDRVVGNWHVADFDYWRWHWLENVVERSPDELCIWETENDGIVALLNQGDPGVCHLQLHPDHRSLGQVSEMIEAAEREYAAPTGDGGKAVWVWAMADDRAIHEVLAERGFVKHVDSPHAIEHYGRRLLREPVAVVPPPEGFAVRSMGDVDELPARSLASWRAFHPDEPDDGCDARGQWYRNVQRAPLYRRDLDVVAVAPNGDVASFATCYFDDGARTGVFVLDGTATKYQRMGLAKAVMTETLRRLRWLGALEALVSWYEDPAGALYRSVGFIEEQRGQAWVKRM